MHVSVVYSRRWRDMASAALDEGGRKAAVAVGEFLNKVKTFALDIKAKVT